MILAHEEILELIRQGVVEHAREEAVNSASLDVHLGKVFLLEGSLDKVFDYRHRRYNGGVGLQPLTLSEDKPLALTPGMFVLAHTVEVFNLPAWLSAEYKLKSSMARAGLDHLNAGWCDAGWHGSTLTLELKNVTNHTTILLRPGDPIGQMIFYRHKEVPLDKSYATRGRYNQQKTVQEAK